MAILIVGAVILAQNGQVDEKKNDGIYGCDSGGDGGHIDIVEKGRVIQVFDKNTVIFKNKKGQIRTVDLLAVDSDASETEANVFLMRKALSKKADLIYSSSQIGSKNINGIIRIKKNDLNRLMLELGIGAHKDSESYQISSFRDCIYTRAEDRAKVNKLGIWAK